jgi:hypothetical protein
LQLGVKSNALKLKHLIELERDIVEDIDHTCLGGVVQAIASK